MTKARQYTDLLDEALRVAGAEDHHWHQRFWNERFRSALQRRGLTLAMGDVSTDRREAYPEGTPFRAPRSIEGPEGWPEESVVIWSTEHDRGVLTRPLLRLREGVPYWPGPADFVIREEHSIDDVLRHLIGECGGDKAELLAILETIEPSQEGLEA